MGERVEVTSHGVPAELQGRHVIPRVVAVARAAGVDRPEELARDWWDTVTAYVAARMPDGWRWAADAGLLYREDRPGAQAADVEPSAIIRDTIRPAVTDPDVVPLWGPDRAQDGGR